MQHSEAEQRGSRSGFHVTAASRVWQLATLERAVLASLAENHDATLALEQLAVGLEHIAAPGTLASILSLDPASGGRLRHGAAPHLPVDYNRIIDGTPIGPCAGSCGTAAFRRETVVVTDVMTDPLWAAYRDLARRAGLRACWSVPILATSGDVLGTFAFYYREPRAPEPEDMVTMDGAARLARIVLERERSERARLRATRREKAQLAAASVLAEAEPVPDAMRDVVRALCGALEWDLGAVWLWDTAGQALVCSAHWSSDDARFASFVRDTCERRLSPGAGLPGAVLLSGEAEWLPARDECGFVRWRSAAAAGIQHGLAFPILDGAEVLGVVELFTTDSEPSDADLLPALRTVGLQVGQFLRRASAQVDRQRLIDELRETLRFSDLFTGILAHDLRNPLSTMLLGTQLLETHLLGQSADARTREVLERMRSSGTRMASMIEQLLDLSRSRQGGRLALLRTPLRLGELARSIVNELSLGFPEARVELRVDGDTEGEWDRDRLAQVLSNLIGNAIEHGERGGTVNVRVAGDGDAVTVHTHNLGTIPAESLSSLFDPFKTTRASDRRSRGLGLGLFITHLVVTAHGGSIDVTSDGGGTRFIVRLPRS